MRHVLSSSSSSVAAAICGRRRLACLGASMSGAPAAASASASAAGAAKPATTTPAATKPTVVMLHGYLQNAAHFRVRTGSLRKGVKSRVGDFLYVDAPYAASEARTVVWVDDEDEEGGGGDGGAGADAAAAAATAAASSNSDDNTSGSATDNETDGAAGDGRSWFCWEERRRRGAAANEPTTRPSRATRYTGWDRSFDAIAAALKEAAAATGAQQQQHQIGLLGFSQGAAAGALFLSDLDERQARGEALDVPRPAFAVLCAGFLPRDAACASLIRRRRAGKIPVLVVTGEQDKLVPRDRSDALVRALQGRAEQATKTLAGEEEEEGAAAAAAASSAAAREWLHPGGHLLPTCSGAFKQRLVAFLDEAAEAAGAAAGG
jgi:predicted esterase